jgi:hypothetical protein
MGRGREQMERVESGHKTVWNRRTGLFDFVPAYTWALRGPLHRHATARRLRAKARIIKRKAAR